jgi:hypothetical protein
MLRVYPELSHPPNDAMNSWPFASNTASFVFERGLVLKPTVEMELLVP